MISDIDIDSVHKDYIVKYVYGFEHGRIFVFCDRSVTGLNHGEILDEAGACVSKGPKILFVEVEMCCLKAELHSTFYNIVQAAYRSPVAHELASKFSFADGEQVLFVTFSKAGDSRNSTKLHRTD